METFDYQDQFERVKKNVTKAFTKALDVQAAGTGLKMKATDVWIDDNQDPSDWQSQRDATRKDKTWGVPVYAAIEMRDRKTDKIISTAKRITSR